MKYLKIFEYYNSEYNKIPTHPALSNILPNTNKEDLIKLRDYLNNYYNSDECDDFTLGLSGYSWETCNIDEDYDNVYSYNFWSLAVLEIYIYDDDWYVVELAESGPYKDTEYYKCDQLHGLISLLNKYRPGYKNKNIR